MSDVRLLQPVVNDIFAQVDYVPDEHDLDKAIAKTGHRIQDVKAVVMGHLHLDHSGGLEHFYGTDVPIYVHELELKHAFYSVATGTDLGGCCPAVGWLLLSSLSTVSFC